MTVAWESVLREHGSSQLLLGRCSVATQACALAPSSAPCTQPVPPDADMGPMLLPGSLPSSITRLCVVPAPARFPPALPPDVNGIVPAELPEQLLALPLAYLDVSESLFYGAHLAAALPRLTRLTSLALDKCELTGASRPGKRIGLLRGCIPLLGWWNVLVATLQSLSFPLGTCMHCAQMASHPSCLC